MPGKLLTRLLAAAVLAWPAGCAPPGPPLKDHGLLVIGRTYDQDPLPGVRLWLDGTLLGATAADGTFAARWPGVDGTRVQVQAECPLGFSDAEFRKELILRAFDAVVQAPVPESPELLQLRVLCHATRRTVVVAIRTGQAELPILRGEQILGRTNALGAAHVAVTVPRRGRFRLALDTRLHPAVRPQQPSKLFEPGDDDAFLPWDQPLTTPPQKKRPRPPPLPPAYRLR